MTPLFHLENIVRTYPDPGNLFRVLLTPRSPA